MFPTSDIAERKRKWMMSEKSKGSKRKKFLVSTACNAISGAIRQSLTESSFSTFFLGSVLAHRNAKARRRVSASNFRHQGGRECDQDGSSLLLTNDDDTHFKFRRD